MELENNQATRKCLKCNHKFSVNSSTSTLTNHLRKHGLLLEDDQQRFGADWKLGSKTPLPIEQRQYRVEEAMATFVIQSSVSFAVVENYYFVKLIHAANPDICVPSRQTICRRILDLYKNLKSKMESFLALRRGRVSLTADAWSSTVYKGYVVITGHWIDANWCLQSVILDFKRFPTPHTADAICTTLMDTIIGWDLASSLRAVTTDNASDMTAGIKGLREKLNDLSPGQYPEVEGFHVRCLAHIINLAVKSCMGEVHDKIKKIRMLLSGMRSSVKRRDLFDKCRKELDVECQLPNLDSETRWSSTFIMIKRAFAARRVLNAVVSRVEAMGDMTVTEMEWKVAERLCAFLETAAAVTEHQSAQKYVTLSIATTLYQKLCKRCDKVIDDGDAILSSVATKMLKKLKDYKTMVETPMAKLARILDPRFKKDFINDAEILRLYVTLPVIGVEGSVGDEERRTEDPIQELLEDNSVDGFMDDEATSFLKATGNGDMSLEPLTWWGRNAERFPHLASVAQDVLAVQSSSVASESKLSWAGNLISDQRTSLSDEIITACMCCRSWQQVL